MTFEQPRPVNAATARKELDRIFGKRRLKLVVIKEECLTPEEDEEEEICCSIFPTDSCKGLAHFDGF